MKKCITFKILRRIVYVIAIMITLFFVKENWYNEPIYSIRLKIASLVSPEAEYLYKQRQFAIDDYIEYCELAKDSDKFRSYTKFLSEYAKKNVSKAQDILLNLGIYSDKYCPNLSKIKSARYYFRKDVFDFLSSKKLDGFVNKTISDQFYIRKMIEFYYKNEYSKYGKELIEYIINKDITPMSILLNLEQELSYEGIIDYDFVDGLSYLVLNYGRVFGYDNDRNQKSINYYEYKLAEMALSENENDITAMKLMNRLAKEGNGHAILYLFNKNEIYKMSLDFQIDYLIKADGNTFYHSANLVYEKLAWLFYNKGELMSSLYYAEKACHNKGGFDCDKLLSFIYFDNKEYDKARKRYNNIFKWRNPVKYGNNGEGVNASKRLGDIYYQGLGIRQDLIKAKEYYGIACDALNQDACTLYKEVNEKL